MSLKRIKFFLLALLSLAGFLFVYGIGADVPLGKKYVWTCFEPGCSITNHELMWNPSNDKLMSGISGDVYELSVNRQYIVGKVCQNEYSKKHSIGTTGYFILDKINLKKSLGMNKDAFMKECKKLSISTKSKYNSPLDLVYDPRYWYMLLQDALGVDTEK